MRGGDTGLLLLLAALAESHLRQDLPLTRGVVYEPFRGFYRVNVRGGYTATLSWLTGVVARWALNEF